MGARLLYRLNGNPSRPLSLAGRFYMPLRQTAGAEAAVGIDWRPTGAPLHVTLERRQALGAEGRSAFSLTVYGGASAPLGRRIRLDAYGQAGIVGVQRRDAFVDGSVSLSHDLGPVEIGAAAWGAVQPGASRLDAGPHLSYRLPVSRANIRLNADWRFRLAGDASPDSGPALTLGADF
jgi:hypothetical protein